MCKEYSVKITIDKMVFKIRLPLKQKVCKINSKSDAEKAASLNGFFKGIFKTTFVEYRFR